MQPRTLLVPTDFSDLSRSALERAIEIAAQDDAEIVLLYALENTDLPTRHLLKAGGFPNVHDEFRAGIQRHLEDQQQETVGDRAKSRAMMKEGHAPTVIADAAGELGADMVVLATHGRRGLKRFFLGSTTERVVRIAPCSVLVVREKRDDPTAEILVPTDFSDNAKVAVTEAAHLAQSTDSKLILLHVISPLPWPVTDALVVESHPKLQQEVRKGAEEQLRELRNSSVPDGVPCELFVTEGYPDEQIVKIADQRGIDTLVMATQGHSGLDRFFLGSTTEKVVRQAHCTVLVAKPK